MSEKKIELNKRIVQNYFVRECERKLVKDIFENKSKKDENVLAQAGREIENNFLKALSASGHLIEMSRPNKI